MIGGGLLARCSKRRRRKAVNLSDGRRGRPHRGDRRAPAIGGRCAANDESKARNLVLGLRPRGTTCAKQEVARSAAAIGETAAVSSAASRKVTCWCAGRRGGAVASLIDRASRTSPTSTCTLHRTGDAARRYGWRTWTARPGAAADRRSVDCPARKFLLVWGPKARDDLARRLPTGGRRHGRAGPRASGGFRRGPRQRSNRA